MLVAVVGGSGVGGRLVRRRRRCRRPSLVSHRHERDDIVEVCEEIMCKMFPRSKRVCNFLCTAWERPVTGRGSPNVIYRSVKVG